MIIPPDLPRVIERIALRLITGRPLFSVKAARDPVEPGQRSKSRAEDNLADVLQTHFDAQRETIRDALSG